MFEGKLPVLKPDDPEFVYVNAAFIALAHPPSRRILELLTIAPRDLRDFRAHVGGDPAFVRQFLDELVQVGFVSQQGSRYELHGPAIDRVKQWMAHLG